MQRPSVCEEEGSASTMPGKAVEGLSTKRQGREGATRMDLRKFSPLSLSSSLI
jgi:hypothetical protein